MLGDMSNPSQTEDNDDGVPLTKVEPLSTKQDIYNDIHLKRISSLSNEYLLVKGIYKNDELNRELCELNTFLEEKGEPRFRISGSRNKNKLVDAVVGAQKALLQLDRSFLERCHTNLELEFASKNDVESEDFQHRHEAELDLEYITFQNTQA
jgi:hypothetical protein